MSSSRVARFGGLMMFLLLEVISLGLVVEYNHYQKRIFIHSANLVSGAVNEKWDAVLDYASYGRQIDTLKVENARLRQQLQQARELQAHQLPAYGPPDDTIRSRYDFIPADIISKTVLGQNNTITIDKGRQDSVYEHMGVISDQGVVGIITQASAHHARVMTILHSQARISAAIKNKGFYGSLVWKNNDPRIFHLEAIPKHALGAVGTGDTVITSGYSNMFPAGIMIGKVQDVSVKTGDNNLTILVELYNDLSNLQYAYVVRNKMLGDLEKLGQ